MSDDLQFLREAELFKGLPVEMLRRVLAGGRGRRWGAGEYVFLEGDRSFDAYLLRSGVVEVQKGGGEGHPPVVVAYLGPGDCFGEMALITGRPRSASARVPQEALALEIPAELFEELTQHPLFLRRLCEVLAFRLERTDSRLAGQPSRRELQGDLRFFDLATMVQTLINTGQDGVMVIDTPHRQQAAITFQAGRVADARYRQLTGEEAFYQIFQEDLEGRFLFSGLTGEPKPEGPAITRGPMNLLLEACRLKDETARLLSRVGDLDLPLRRVGPDLAWPDPDTRPVAEHVWLRAGLGATARQMVREIPRCSYWTLTVIDRLLTEGRLRCDT